MNWHSSAFIGEVTAVGYRGIYTTRPHGSHCVLCGVGHDGLPMLALPPFGRAFTYPAQAREYAEKLDAFVHAEAYCSGV
jgi:hypothetical protein